MIQIDAVTVNESTMIMIMPTPGDNDNNDLDWCGYGEQVYLDNDYRLHLGIMIMSIQIGAATVNESTLIMIDDYSWGSYFTTKDTANFTEKGEIIYSCNTVGT